MFNKDFYPTPENVIHLMINGEDLIDKFVLEPSAGSGNILDVLNGLGAKTIACETNEDLALISKQKAGKFLKSDFLEVTREEVSHIDYIIMNPPFSADDKHITHAWEIAPDGCQIVSLCNYETLNNQFSLRRNRLGGLIKSYGFSDNLGDVFSDAERTTGVNIGLVRLFKPSANNSFEGYFDMTEDEEERQENGIMSYNAVREVVQRYIGACKLYDEVAENAVAMNGLVGVFGLNQLTFSLESKDKDTDVQNFKVELQKRAWKWVFSKMGMNKYMTASLKEELNRFTERQSKVPFTMKNIYRMFDMVVQTHDQRMQKVFIEVFEKLTKHHKENRHNVEGWKTNSHYMVNEKFILEGVVSYGYGTKLTGIYDSRNVNLIDDFVKALDYITGQNNVEEYGYFYQWSNKEYLTPNKWYKFAYWEIKVFKKGTMHAKFLSRDVWAMFNQAVAKSKGYELPENF